MHKVYKKEFWQLSFVGSNAGSYFFFSEQSTAKHALEEFDFLSEEDKESISEAIDLCFDERKKKRDNAEEDQIVFDAIVNEWCITLQECWMYH